MGAARGCWWMERVGGWRELSARPAEMWLIKTRAESSRKGEGRRGWQEARGGSYGALHSQIVDDFVVVHWG